MASTRKEKPSNEVTQKILVEKTNRFMKEYFDKLTENTFSEIKDLKHFAREDEIKLNNNQAIKNDLTSEFQETEDIDQIIQNIIQTSDKEQRTDCSQVLNKEKLKCLKESNKICDQLKQKCINDIQNGRFEKKLTASNDDMIKKQISYAKSVRDKTQKELEDVENELSEIQRLKIEENRSVETLPMLKYYMEDNMQHKTRDASAFVKKLQNEKRKLLKEQQTKEEQKLEDQKKLLEEKEKLQQEKAKLKKVEDKKKVKELKNEFKLKEKKREKKLEEDEKEYMDFLQKVYKVKDQDELKNMEPLFLRYQKQFNEQEKQYMLKNEEKLDERHKKIFGEVNHKDFEEHEKKIL